ncbi:MAG: diguanylate cyclase, partial [Desulfobacterales bacterium]
MDGLDLTAEVKREHNVDVIVMTGYSEEYSYESVINKGASDLIFKPIHFEELVLRIKRVLRERQLSQGQIEMMRKLKKLAITDGLTKLFNSRHFYNMLELEVDRSNRYAHALALLLLDIDNFKKYNDTYGHLEGDKVLVRLGQAIHTCLRSMDSAYRYGGEEFTVILPETKGEEALAVAERIRTVVENESFSPRSDTKAPITISLGVTEFYPKEKIETFVKRADEAMYLSKDQGRNRVSSLFKN